MSLGKQSLDGFRLGFPAATGQQCRGLAETVAMGSVRASLKQVPDHVAAPRPHGVKQRCLAPFVSCVYGKRCERPTGRSVIDDYDSWKFHGINSSIWLCG